jgi:hypothetical protein
MHSLEVGLGQGLIQKFGLGADMEMEIAAYTA